MNWRINICCCFLFFSACITDIPDEVTAHTSPFLIEAQELKEIHQKAHVRILDFRKKEDYEVGHIPGAIQISRKKIMDTSFEYGGMRASRKQLETLLGYFGIRYGDLIIIYDDKGLCNAARLWWMLRNYNYEKVRMLHGGLESWEAIGGEVSTDLPMVQPSQFRFDLKPRLEFLAEKSQVLDAIENETLLLDTRTLEEYSGKRQKKGAYKGGRIPTSLRIDWAEAIHYDGDMRFKSKEELEKIYGLMGVPKDAPIIAYCHSGVRSAHTTFVLTELLGYNNVRNYDGSWTEWSFHEDLPWEQDSLTVILQ